MSSPYEQNLKRLSEIADKNDLVLNPDEERVQKVVGLMAGNYEQVQEWICPCKQTQKPSEKGKDKTCPCNEWMSEINELGHCYCKLFYTKEKAAEQ